jgi:VWFA-related protein
MRCVQLCTAVGRFIGEIGKEMQKTSGLQSGRIEALALITILLLSSVLFLGQDLQLHTKVDLVVVPVSARDGSGSLVTSLTTDDFTILEDGRPQTIANFSTDPQALSVAVIVDTGMGAAELHRLTPLIAALIREFKPSDEVAVYRYDHFVVKLSFFTNDPQTLEKSFDAVKQIAETKPAESAPGTALGPSPLRWIFDRTQIGSIGAPPTPSTSRPPPASTTRPAASSKVLHDAVFAAALDLEKRPTDHRKIVVLISNGQVVGHNEHPRSETNERLLRNGIQFYAVSTDLKMFEHFTVLNSYARDTGGQVFDGGTTAAMDESFAKLVEQARDQYVLGYVSNNEISGTSPVFRKIGVKARDPKLKIIHRQGYLQYP